MVIIETILYFETDLVIRDYYMYQRKKGKNMMKRHNTFLI